MNKNKFFIATIVILLITNLLLVGFLLFRKPPHPPMDGPKKFIIENLHFDKNQADEFLKLVNVHKESTKKLKDKIHSAKSSLYETLSVEDSTKKDSLLSEISNYQTKIEVLNYNHFLDIKKICKTNQMVDYEELTKKLSGFFSDKPPMKR